MGPTFDGNAGMAVEENMHHSAKEQLEILVSDNTDENTSSDTAAKKS